MNKRHSSWVIWLSNFGYIVGCLSLFVIAFCIIITSIWGIFSDLFSANYTVYALLDEVGFIVFSVAVIDVCKYLMIEEVFKMGEEKGPSDTRKAANKFVVIITTALSLEGLVLTIEVAKEDITKIWYPISLLIVAPIMYMGFGVYQYLSAKSEK